MSDALQANGSSASSSGLIAQRTGVKKPPKREARRAFWRTLTLVRPHRRKMIWGIVLGFGVALTYAATLAGLYPVLQVVTKQEGLHTVLTDAAAKHRARADDPHDSMRGLQASYASSLEQTARLFPAIRTGAEDAAADRMRDLLIVLGLLLGMNIAGNIFRVVSQYLILNASNRMMMDLRRRMYRKALRVPMTELTGDVSNRVNQFMSDVREVFLGVTTLFGKVAREPLKAICVLVVAIVIDYRLTLIILAITPMAVGFLWFFGRKVRKATVKILQGYGEMLRSLDETLQGVEVVKGYGKEGYERRRMWKVERRMLKQMLKLAWIEAFSSPLIEVLGILITCAGIVWLASRTFHGDITPAHFMTMVALLAALLDPVRKVANVYNMVQRAGAASTRIWDFLDQPEEQSPPHAKRLSDIGSVRFSDRDSNRPTDIGSERLSDVGSIPLLDTAPGSVPSATPRAVRFEHLTFRYTPAQDPPALCNVSLEVKPGECLAIVGPNGSGKSTLVKTLPRLLEPQAGRTFIDGCDVRELSLRDLRLQIAVVTQRPVLFARSVFENIAYGCPDATLDQVRDAARHAYAAEFIEQWPQQYDTVLGEFGSSISGGQRQRLSIARAFLKPASILIFDEATSEVDAESERKIHDALNTLRRGKTTFLIAHRHTVMDMAERIVVMDGGQIVDVGTQAELLARCPLFVALYRSPTA